MKLTKKIKFIIILLFFGIAIPLLVNFDFMANIALEKYEDISKKYGFTLEHVEYDHVPQYCPNIAEFHLFREEFGKPIFSVSIGEAKEKLLNIDCIKHVSISRILPDIVKIKVIEKTPIAIWQNGMQFLYISDDGSLMGIHNTQNIENFIILVGKNAPHKSHHLLDILDANTEIKQHIISAILISDRRWNVQLDNGIEVLLPEHNPEIAWQRFIELVEKHNILAIKKKKTYDFRIENKLIVS